MVEGLLGKGSRVSIPPPDHLSTAGAREGWVDARVPARVSNWSTKSGFVDRFNGLTMVV